LKFIIIQSRNRLLFNRGKETLYLLHYYAYNIIYHAVIHYGNILNNLKIERPTHIIIYAATCVSPTVRPLYNYPRADFASLWWPFNGYDTTFTQVRIKPDEKNKRWQLMVLRIVCYTKPIQYTVPWPEGLRCLFV